MIETIITIAASWAAYRAVLAWANRGMPGSARESLALAMGGILRRSGGSGEERAIIERRSGGSGEEQ
jgi:hypothetical protein